MESVVESMVESISLSWRPCFEGELYRGGYAGDHMLIGEDVGDGGQGCGKVIPHAEQKLVGGRIGS